METMVKKAKTLNPKPQVFILLNRASPNPSVSEAEEAKEILSDLEQLGLAQAIIRDRIAFRKAARDGLAVPEMQPADPEAVSEMQEIYKEIYHG